MHAITKVCAHANTHNMRAHTPARTLQHVCQQLHALGVRHGQARCRRSRDLCEEEREGVRCVHNAVHSACKHAGVSRAHTRAHRVLEVGCMLAVAEELLDVPFIHQQT